MDTRNLVLTAHWKTFDKGSKSSRSMPEKRYKAFFHLKEDTPKNQNIFEIQKFQKYYEDSFLNYASPSF